MRDHLAKPHQATPGRAGMPQVQQPAAQSGSIAYAFAGQRDAVRHQTVEFKGLVVHGVGAQEFAMLQQISVPCMVGHDEYALAGAALATMLDHAGARAFVQKKVDK